MAKKQQIILTHGTGTPGSDVIKGLKLGEVLVQHAAEAKDAALHTALKEGEEAVLVSFPSKEWVNDSIAALENEKTQQAIADLNDRLTTAEGEIDDLQAEDTQIRTDFAAADTQIRTDFAAADNVVRGEFAAADAALKLHCEGLIEDLDERVGANADAITALQGEDTKIRQEFAAADDVVRGEFAAADAALKAGYEAADTQIRTDFAAADSDLDERITANAEAITALQEADTAMEAAYKAADDVVRGEFAAADAALKAGYEAADTQIRTDFAAADEDINERIDVIVGEDANKSMRTVANEELAKQLIPEGAQESLDTLQEIAQWIQQHPEDAAAMNAAIAKNASDIAANKKTSDDAEAALDERVTANAEAITALQEADTAMEAAYKAADDVVRGEFAAADSALETAYKAADSALETAYKAADSALDEKINTNAEAITALQEADTAMEAAYKAADDVVRGEFAAADSALETAYKAADKAIEDAYKAADDDLDERIGELENTYVKSVVVKDAAGEIVATYTPVGNVLDLTSLIIDGGEY